MGQTKNLGIVAPVPKGSWSASQSYDRLNIVRHGNASYIAIVANIAVEPAVTQRWENSWMLLASDGSQTPSGANDYNLLENQPIFNVDLTTLATPVVNEYYRHIGATTNQFINGCIYRYDGTQFIILGDLDKSIADKTYSNALKGNVGGTAIRIDDLTPFEDSVEVNVSGVSNPESVTVSRCGKNLIPFPYYDGPVTRLGVTFTIREDGAVICNGTCTDQGNTYFRLIRYAEQPLLGFLGDEPWGTLREPYATKNGVTLSPYLYYNGNAQLTVNPPVGELVDFVIYPQMELGTTLTAYEQYIAPTTYTPDSNGSVTIPILRPSMSLLTNNSNANLSATYNRDINAAINGTTETQPLATVDYVNTAIENNKYYQHVFSGGISNTDGPNVVEFTFSMISKQETALVEVASPNYTDPSKFITFLSNTFNGKVPNFTGFVSAPTLGFIMSVSATNNDISVQYKGTDYGSFSISANAVDITESYPLTETIIEI